MSRKQSQRWYWEEVIDAVAAKTGHTKKSVREILQAYASLVVDRVFEKGEKVPFHTVGLFERKERCMAARKLHTWWGEDKRIGPMRVRKLSLHAFKSYIKSEPIEGCK